MQIDHKRPKTKPETIVVRINATRLDDRMVALLQGLLASDQHIHSVEAELPHVEVIPSEGMGFLTIEAAAEPVILVVHLIAAHAKEIVEAAKKLGEGAETALGAAAVQYVIKTIKQLRKNRDSLKQIGILGADGNVVKLVTVEKGKTGKKHAAPSSPPQSTSRLRHRRIHRDKT
jgi:hypothetical protein